MATYTTRLGFIKQATNENVDDWGEFLNDEMIQRVDDAVAGVATLVLTGSHSLTADEARKAVLNVTSTGGVARTVTVPSVEKVWRVRNAGTSTVLFKTAAGVGVVVLQGTSADIFCDGAECYRTGVSGWGLLSTTNIVSGTTNYAVSLAVTGQKFDNARFVYNFLPTTSVSFSVTGAPGTSSPATNTNVGTAGYSGTSEINQYSAGFGKVEIAQGYFATDGIHTVVTQTTLVWRMTGGLTALNHALGASANSGSISCYLR